MFVKHTSLFILGACFFTYLINVLISEALCELQVATTETDEMVIIDKVKKLEMSSSDKMLLLPSNVNCLVKSKNINKKQKDSKKMIEIFVPPTSSEIDRLDRENHNWNHVQTFKLFFDNELINFIVQITNAYAIETNAVGWVAIDRSDFHCFLKILILSGYVQLPSRGRVN